MSPRQHPTGLTALAASAAVIVAAKLGVELTAEEAAVFVGLLARPGLEVHAAPGLTPGAHSGFRSALGLGRGRFVVQR